MDKTKTLLTTASLLLIISIPLFSQITVDPEISALIQQVDTSSIADYIRDMASSNGNNSRVTFTPGADWAASYIYQKFSEMPGLTSVEYDTFYISGAPAPWNTYPLVNIVATLAGSSQSDRYLIISGHYDTSGSNDNGWSSNWASAAAPGADDNGSGVASMLEIARILSDTSNSFGNDMTIKFVAFAAEERAPAANNLNHQGSHHFASRAYQRSDDIAGVYNIDMIGYNTRGYRYTNIVSNQASEELGTRMLDVNQAYQLGVITNTPPFPEETYSDHERFWFYNYKAILLIENAPPWYSNLPYYAANIYYHTYQDTPEKVSLEQVGDVTKLTLGTAAHFVKTPTSIAGSSTAVPGSFSLNPNFPNPFNSTTTISFHLDKAGPVKLAVYNSSGQMIDAVISERLTAGSHKILWKAASQDGTELPSGVYFTILRSGTQTVSQKMILIK